MVIEHGNFSVKVKTDQYIVYKKSKNQKKEDVESLVGYYTTLPAAIKKMIQDEMSDYDMKMSLKEYLQACKDMFNEIEKVFDVC